MSGLKNIKLSKPTYNEVVPSNSKKVKITPFKVGDEKTLLIAAESKDPKQMMEAMKQIIGNNVEGMEVEDMAPYDMEYLFLKLRSVSVGEIAKVTVPCGGCEKHNEIEIDIPSVKVIKDASHTNIVRIDDGLGFEMKWPDIDDMAEGEDADTVLKMVAGSIKTVYYGEETIDVGEAEREDMISLLTQLTTKQFGLVQKFFETAPKLSHEVAFTCEHCGDHNTKRIEGLANFF